MTSSLSKVFAGSVLSLTATAFAWDTPPLSCSPSANKEDHCRVSIRHIEGGGIGYNQGYTTLEGFFASDPEQTNLMPFLDLRGHVFDNGYMAANAGIGFRRVLEPRIYGLNAYYDYRDTKYSQLGLGFEALGNSSDLRVNGYLPVGQKSASHGDAQFSEFSGHEMIITQKYQFAMKGADAEFGFPFAFSPSFDIYAAIGPYYYVGELGSGTWGGKARVKAQFGRYVALEASNAADHMFHNNFQVQLTFTLPLDRKLQERELGANTQEDARLARSSMVQPVEREEIIVLGNKWKKSVAINPDTDQPYFFVFVNNTSNSQGTFESPYPTLAQAEANSHVGDIIYVFPGDGTTNGMDSGITLKPKQKFWGSGVAQQLGTTQGNIVIPAYTLSIPQMTNTAGNGITLASNNQISGFLIKDTADYGIVGINPQNVQIFSTTLDHSVLDQIHLEYTEAGSVNFNNLHIINGESNAIFIDSTATSMSTRMNNSIIQDNLGQYLAASFTGETSFSFTNNLVDHNNSSTLSFGGTSTLIFRDNTFTNSVSISSAPIYIIAGPDRLSATIENNTISDNTCGAIHFVLNETSFANLVVNHNTITDNGSGSIGPFGAAIFMNLNSTSSNNAQLLFTDNIITGNAGSALYNANGDFDNYTVSATGNLMNGNGAGMIFANSSELFTLIATDNTITNSQDHGISTAGGVTIGTASLFIANNQLTGSINSGSGLALSHEGTTLNLIVSANNISNNDGSGISLYSSGVIENVLATIENNTINNNQNSGTNSAGGLAFEQYTNLTATVRNNELNNNVGYGMFVDSLQLSPSVCLSMRSNTTNTDYVLSSGTGTFNLTPLDVNALNIGTITTIGSVTVVATCP